ncbi:MAG: HAD family hydrolase [Lachnospiraceae bacterium]
MKGVIFDFDGTIFYDEEIPGKKEAYSRECCLKSPDFHLAPEFPAFLDRLLEEKIPFTIATASGKNKVRFFFEHLELERWFDPEQVVYNDGTLPEKPELYLKAAKRLAVSPEECMIFEDSVSGLESARQAAQAGLLGSHP